MAVHPKRVSNLGIKFNITFVIVSLKTDSRSLTFKLMSADPQSNKSTALFIYQCSLGKNAIQFSHKEVGKKHFK